MNPLATTRSMTAWSGRPTMSDNVAARAGQADAIDRNARMSAVARTRRTSRCDRPRFIVSPFHNGRHGRFPPYPAGCTPWLPPKVEQLEELFSALAENNRCLLNTSDEAA